MDTVEYILPTHFACALINSDESGLEESDSEALNRFVEDMVKEYGMFHCIDVDEEGEGFLKYHDLQPYGVLACDCAKFTFQIGV